MSKKQLSVWLLCGLALVTAGCTSYYRVSDPSGGSKDYYTTDIDKLLKNRGQWRPKTGRFWHIIKSDNCQVLGYFFA